MLARRLAHWLNRAIDAGRAAPGSASDGEEGADEMEFDERPRACKAALVEHAAVVGEMPDDGVDTAEQTGSRATRKSTRGGALEYLLAVSCAGLCPRCNCRVDACPLSDLVVVNFPDYAGPCVSITYRTRGYLSLFPSSCRRELDCIRNSLAAPSSSSSAGLCQQPASLSYSS